MSENGEVNLLPSHEGLYFDLTIFFVVEKGDCFSCTRVICNQDWKSLFPV